MASNFSFRYQPDDEELDDSYETSSCISTSNISAKSDGPNEEINMSTEKSQNRQEKDKWKILREVKVRITKSVEEKLEEMKSQSKQRRSILGQMENSSVSDSEEQSESSLLSASDKSVKSAPESLLNAKTPTISDERQESDINGSQGSTPERSTTPVPEESMNNSDPNVLGKHGKLAKCITKRRKSKSKSDKISFDKTFVSYSDLVDKDINTEVVELAEEVSEAGVRPEQVETKLARELDRLAHPPLPQQVLTFIYDWHILVVPMTAFITNWFIHLPQYVIGCLIGVVGLLLLQRLVKLYYSLLGAEPPIKQLKDMLPLTEVPIFNSSSGIIDTNNTVYEGWMNEYTREYRPDTYHITLTDTVYVRLEGSKLCLSSPRSKIPKRALWNEPRYNLHFNRERLYDIANCSIQLRPEGLIHRRIWSKKYPICIALSQESRLGVRHREQSQETIDPNAPWIEEESYNFETVSEDSEDENTVPSHSLDRKDSDAGLSGSNSLDQTSQDVMEEGFVKVSPYQNKLLYLFARADREKEIWYRRFVNAAGLNANIEASPKPQMDYISFMMALSQRTVAHLPTSKEQNSKSPIKTDLSISMEMMWLNAFFGRLLFDIFQDSDKLVRLQEKIQHKLSAIKLPMFLEKLEVTQLDLGQSVPIVQRASRPQMDSRGVWVDLDIVYEGGFRMTVDTKVNLNRIKQLQAESPNSESPKSGSPAKCVTSQASVSEPLLSRKSAVYDSSVEDSAETSGEEPDLTRLQDPSAAGPVAQHKYLRLLDKVTQSKYFQQVADYKFIKKFVSGNSLQLIVEVKGLLGTLVLNIPPPPSDRLWYGFRKNPKLWLSAYPKFGQHAVHVISRIIEKKLCLEFQRLLVLPNMDDLLIPIMDHKIPS